MTKQASGVLQLPGELDPVQFREPELAKLARALPTILVQHRAPGTVRTYISSFNLWKEWAKGYNAPYLPADVTHFALYLVFLIQQERSLSTVNSAIYGVNWVHKICGHAELAAHPLISQIREAAQRILAKAPKRKSPLSTEVVKSILSRLADGNLAELQVAAFVALGFFGFLRWDDLTQLSLDCLKFETTHLAVFLEKRKNDQFRQGSWVMISRSAVEPCPVQIIQSFIDKGRHVNSSKLFRKILHSKNGFSLRADPMSYSRANELFKAELKKEGLDTKSYGLHSLRAGGATAAAALGVPDRLFQRHGGWRSEKAKNNYVMRH